MRRPAVQKIGYRTIRPYTMNAMRRPSTPLKMMGVISRYLTCTQTNTGSRSSGTWRPPPRAPAANGRRRGRSARPCRRVRGCQGPSRLPASASVGAHALSWRRQCPIIAKLGMHLTQVAPRSCGCRRAEACDSVQGPRRPCVWEAFGGRLGRR